MLIIFCFSPKNSFHKILFALNTLNYLISHPLCGSSRFLLTIPLTFLSHFWSKYRSSLTLDQLNKAKGLKRTPTPWIPEPFYLTYLPDCRWSAADTQYSGQSNLVS